MTQLMSEKPKWAAFGEGAVGNRIGQFIPTARAGQYRLVVYNNTPLDRVYLSGKISQDAYLAAARYAETWEAAGLRPRVTGDYEEAIGAGGAGGGALEQQNAAQARAHRLFERARKAIPLSCRDVVGACVLWQEEPKCLALLCFGLDALVRYYDRQRHG